MSEVQIPTPEELEDTVKKNKEEAKKECWDKVRRMLNIAKEKKTFLYTADVRDIPDDEFKEVMKEKGFSVKFMGEEAPFGYIIRW